LPVQYIHSYPLHLKAVSFFRNPKTRLVKLIGTKVMLTYVLFATRCSTISTA